MAETNFPEGVLAHEAALVDESVHAIDMSFSGVLPHDEVAVISQDRFPLGVLGDHQFVTVYLPAKITVVKVGERVE